MLDQRRADRNAVSIEAVCLVGDREFPCLIRCLSSIGCFVATEEQIPEGSRVVLAFRSTQVPHGAQVAGISVRAAGRNDDHIGFAVEFAEPLKELETA